jgi:hypothetical protein
MNTEPADKSDAETEHVRSGTGPRTTVSVLFISLALAVLAGAGLAGYFYFLRH